MNQKKTFTTLLFITVVILMLLPFITTFNEFLTRIVEQIGFYRIIQEAVVPYEVKLIVAFLHLFHIQAFGDSRVVFLMRDGAEVFKAQIIWSCVGWQSFILLLLTLLTGLQGNFSLSSRIETIIIGIFGTFWMNILRISLVYLFGYYFGQLPATLFHNYASTLMIIVWLCFFWYVSYTYFLRETALH